MAKKNKKKQQTQDNTSTAPEVKNEQTKAEETSTTKTEDNNSRRLPVWVYALIALLLIGLTITVWSLVNNANNNSNSSNDSSASVTATPTSEATTSNVASPTSTNTPPTPTTEVTATTSPSPTNTPSPTTTPTSDSSNNGTNTGTNQSSGTTSSIPNDSERYTYTVVRGDSLTKVGRNIFAQYLKENNITLNNNQKVYLETNLTKQYGSIKLRVGQVVNVKKTDVKSWVDRALALTPAQQKPWEKYARNVKFS